MFFRRPEVLVVADKVFFNMRLGISTFFAFISFYY
ncbi:Uncharacterised protein [Neisseria zoodegmatis]|uniref:Uncharacterized protein n=1 Tax=Neisseria zoodegmatis TaxID=326523 RepID=A0A378WG31_9NEIS|nr:Uncharacterised protein [Neisseria zoodegmatis]